MSSEIHARFRQIRGGMDCASGTFWPFRHSFFSWKEVHRSSSGHSERKWHADQTVSINIVSELLGIFKEHDFLHKLNSLKQLKSLKQLLLNFLHAFAVMGRVCWRKTKVFNLGFICQLAGKRGKNQWVQAVADAREERVEAFRYI